ncbi:MAG: hypothetical protein ABWZ91_14250 [Nocardioides sp.]
MRFDLETIASPDQVRAALTDFTDRRLETWRRTLDPKRYELRELGDTWAVAKEASPGSPFWVVLRYDWSEPDVVRWSVVDSSYGGGGDGAATITPATSRGSHLDVHWSNDGPRQRALLWLLHHLPLDRLVARMWRQALDRYADTGGRHLGGLDPGD